MLMTEGFEKLKTLQDILTKKYDIESKIKESPQQMNAQDELLARLKKEYIEKNSEYEETCNKVKQFQEDLDKAIATRESCEKDMDNITTHHEYEVLDKQISEAKASEDELRKELQKVEKTAEELNEILKSDEEMISSQESDLKESKSSLQNELDEYKKELTVLEAQEKEITPDLDQEIVYKFQRIIQRNSQGIVPVKKGVCGGCHMILPAQFANEVRSGEKILFCPYCSRILYYEPDDEPAQENFNMDEAGSLSDLAADLAIDLPDIGE